MKILAITPSVPYPSLSGSTIIAYNHLKYLALAGHQIDLCTFRLNHQNSFADLSDYCNLRYIFSRPRRLQILAKLVLGAFMDLPIATSHFWSPRCKAQIAALCKQENYDAIYCQLSEMAQFVPKSLLPKTTLSIEDPMSLKHERMLPWQKGTVKKIIWRYEIKRIRRYEKLITNKIGKVILLNEDDMHDYKIEIGTQNIDWVNYGVNTDYFSFEQKPRDQGMIVITGNMFHPPNVKGVLEFVNNVFPLVCAKEPNASLWLVGAHPVDEIKKLHDGKRIHVTGFVEDIRTYLNKAQVSVCTVTLKIGTQTKILEALACGTPVVSTPEGNNGIRAEHGKDILIGCNAKEIAEHILFLLNNENWSAISKQSRKFVIRKFTWQSNVKKLENIIKCLSQK